MMYIRRKDNTGKKIKEWGWIELLNRKSQVGNLSDGSSVILSWNKNTSLNSLAVLTVTKLTHISGLIRSELTGLPRKENQTKTDKMAHIQVFYF